MYPSKREGFTLIELLTVIAIIAILAAMVFAGFGRVREIAKLRSLDNAFIQIRNIAAAYYSTNSSYPIPLGGVIPIHKINYQDIQSGALTASAEPDAYWSTFQSKPYTFALGIHESGDFVDPFSLSTWDTDQSGFPLSLMEYLPLGYKANPTTPPIFAPDLPTPSGGSVSSQLADELDQLADKQEQRPFTYVAVNKRHAKAAARYWTNNTDPYASTWDWNDSELRTVVLPTTYDTFVLVSMGPGGSTFGILADDPTLLSNARNLGETYYLAQLRAFFLATRDWDEDRIPDLSFQGRGARGNEYDINGTTNKWNLLPPNSLGETNYGPYVFSYGWD